jgi:hypothetical protein
VHERVEVPEPVTLVGVIVPHVRPAGTVSVRDTTLENPLRAVTVIVDVVDWPMSTAPGELADVVKSKKLKVAVAEWTSEPLVPVRVTL